MGRAIDIKLTFNADTADAKKRIQELQASLREVAKLPGQATELFDSTSIRQASEAAMELERHLSKAVDVNTGKLDLSRFSSSLKASGKDLNSYCQTLLSIGPTGQQAFLSLAKSIATAEVPVTRVNAKLKEFGQTLANTARWQISSSILHGLMGSVQSAFNYAQDLNRSLTDIRIVTGKSTDEMAKFAKKANDAARALSATTTEYTNASLIYFQQGDSMAEVEEKAAITVKMAQVTGQSMENVSSQMTAVWNNFYDGSQSLEHYADALAKLGAITASSSDEIAQGLEKFAAVADMIGLGFDEAAAALATVTANTRQSADVVGTAFKTIFARIQGLNLGETLEDGTTLNKYSEALYKVGINIKDTSGQMKDMDTILNEMGNKWNTLSKDQQTALAQTVAGVRQYGQLVALMENYDEYQTNLTEAQGSDGELARQSEDYAEGWEAAKDRVQAALEGVYDSLINDKFFINLLNGLEKFIKGIETFIDTFGGFGGVLQSVGGIFLTLYANKMPEVMSGLTQNIRTLTGQAKKDMEAMQLQMGSQLTLVKADVSMPESFKIQAEGIEKVNIMKQKLVKASETLTAAEREEYEARIRNVEAMYKDIDVLVQKKQAAEKNVTTSKGKAVGASMTRVQDTFSTFNTLNTQASKHETKIDSLNSGPTTEAGLAALEREEAALEQVRAKINEVDASISSMAKAYGLTAEQVEKLVAADGAITPDIYREIQARVEEVATSYSNLITKRTALDDMITTIHSQTAAWDAASQEINETAAQLEAMGKKGEAQKLLISSAEQMKKKMEAYLVAVAKVAKDKGLDNVAKRAEAAKKKIEAMKAAMMVKEGKVDISSMISTDEFDDMIGAADETMGELDSQIEHVTDQMTGMNFDPTAMKELEQSAQEAADANVDLTNALENTNQQAEESPKSSFKMSEALTSIAGAAMATMAAVTALSNGFSTLFSSDASFGERIAASISMITASIAAYNAIVAVSTALKKSDTIAAFANAMGMKIVGLFSKTAVVGKTAESAAVWANTAAWYANPIMWIALIVVGVIAALAALVAIITLVSKALGGMDSGAKLKAAEEEASRMAEELEKAKQAADNLRQSIDKYDSAVEKMKTLTEGTAEYRAALDEANAEARKLIDENSDLEGKYHFNVETGLIEFDEGALDEVQAKADKKLAMVQSNEIAARNNVALAKNNVLLDEADVNKKETAAINNLVAQYMENDGNISAATAGLSDADKELIAALDMTDNELSSLVAELAKNNDIITENNKQLVHANFGDTEEYKESSNKEFLNELMGAEISSKADELYEEEYKDGAGMKDKEIQKAYAEMMGWDPDEVENKSGNKAVYKDAEGNEVELDDETVRKYLAQQKAIEQAGESLGKHAEKVEALEDKEKELARAFEGGVITYDEYIEEVEKAGKELGFTSKEMEKYTKTYGSDVIKQERKKQDLTSTMTKRMGMDSDQAKAFVNQIAQDMTAEQLEIALDIAATAESLDDFQRQFEHAATEALLDSIESSSSNVSSILANANENGKFSSADLLSLEQDDNFTKWLEENNKTMRDLTTASYSAQYNIISQFYSDLQRLEQENLDLQKQNYQDDLAEYQAIMDYKMAKEKGDTETLEAISSEWGDNIDFEAYMDLNTEELQSKLDEVSNRLQEITDKKYELDLSWNGIDQLEGAMDEMAGVTKMMEKDAKKVGDSYQITAAQGREWMEMYPELFENAQVTTDGLIELSEADYEAFKAAQEAETEAAIDTEIAKLEARLAELDEEEAAARAELELVQAIAEGTVNYETASAEAIAATRQNLTQFYIDSGYDEVSANQMALEQMSLDQKRYNELVANSTQANAEDMASGASAGANAIKNTFSNLINTLKGIFSNLGKAIKAIFSGDFDSVGSYLSSAWNSATSAISKQGAYFTSASDTVQESASQRVQKYSAQAVLNTKNDAFANVTNNLNERLDSISASRAGIGNKITYLNALKNQGISNYGESSAVAISPEDIESMEEAVERYHELNKEAEALEHTLSKIESDMDAAFGADKIRLMREQQQALEDLKDTQESLLAAQIYNQAADLSALEAQFADIESITIDTDENGNISNYAEIVAAAQADYNAAVAAFNNTSQSEEDKEALEQAEALYEARMDALEQYEDTVDAVRDAEETIWKTQQEISAAALERITYTLDYQIEIDDRELEWLDYQLNKTADNFYSKAENASLLIGSLGADGNLVEGGKLDKITDDYSLYQAAKQDLDANYANGTLTDADYVAGLQEITSGTMDNIDALTELDQTVLEYYGETLNAAQEQLDNYTAKMEHHNSVLDHYKNLVSLISGESDYKAIGAVLEGQAKVAANSLQVSTEAYNMYMDEAEKWATKMNAATEGSAEFELYKKNWEAAAEKARESQEQMLSDVEAWAEAEKAILENTLADLGKTLEQSLTGGMSFDKLNTEMERAQSLQEEYLTTTNKIYETTKMMRTAQQAIDASTNSVAKDKLKNFITETKSLQEQGKLSQYELDMQQAKYDLLVAEIALEEAQNAKSTVRLQRDSEGNFGYVYTADANAVGEAQQQFDDAQNALYNKGLEGANDYTQKYQQTMSEMTDTLKTIQEDYLNGSYSSEAEYQAAMEESKAYYFEKLQNYSSLYQTALSADSNIAAEAWSTDFASMTQNTDEWAQAVDNYITGATQSFQDWATTVSAVKETTGTDLTLLSQNVAEITDANDALAAELTNSENGVIKAMEDELVSVGNLTAAYGDYRQAVMDTITSLEQLAVASNGTITSVSLSTSSTTSGDASGTGAATGGLTSDWGPEGKMLMVHESELILNKDQTNKFFENLAIMETILSTIDAYAMSQQFGGALTNPTYQGGQNGTLEQNVKIEASFPGVTDRNEIEEAFNNLVNKASQYANRT